VAEDFSLLSLIYNLILLEAQPKNLDVEDSLTGFYNQHFYKRILDKEVDRSKRSFTPLSVIKVAVDIFREIEVSHGKSFCDEIIKKVADVIKSTSRLPDYACRTSDNEFSILLTNCNRKGAALRAERLRQQLKTESFSKSGILVTVSQGISEYPSLTRSAEALDESARKALDFIATKGGDKICIHKAAQDHRPDFQVNN
jgi:diguanylate cyclase (GGDEF)-like protein